MGPGGRLGGLFYRFWAASALANLGDGIRLAAFPLLAASLTDDPFAVAAVGAAIMPALLLAAPTTWAALVVVIATSAGFGVLNVAAVSVRQRLTPARLLGRVSAAWRTVLFGAGAVGGLGGGAVASWQGLQAPFALSATLGLIAVALWWLSTRHGPEPLVPSTA